MATNVAYLEGGPCGGTTHKITAGDTAYGSIRCKGGLYVISDPAKYHKGERIFTYAGKAVSPGTTGPGDAPHALGGWKALRKSVNSALPATLTYSQRVNRATLRSLARAHRVRF